jgi:hypothetical protein
MMFSKEIVESFTLTGNLPIHDMSVKTWEHYMPVPWQCYLHLPTCMLEIVNTATGQVQFVGPSQVITAVAKSATIAPVAIQEPPPPPTFNTGDASLVDEFGNTGMMPRRRKKGDGK